MLQLREGLGWLADPRLPAVPGGDVAGVVLEADASSAFKPGPCQGIAATGAGLAGVLAVFLHANG